MTLAEFLKRLRKTPRYWRLKDNGEIRTVFGACPITEVHGEGLSIDMYYRASRELGLEDYEAEAIKDAADGILHDEELRNQLLKACGIG